MRIPSEYGGVSFHITKYENLRKIGSRSKLVEFLKEIVDDYKGNIDEEVIREYSQDILKLGRTYYFRME